MTITEKILAAHCEKEEVKAGEFVECNVDVALGNDITAPIAIKQFRDSGVKEVFDKKRVVLVPDHFTPNKDIKSAEQVKILRDFAKEQKIENFFKIGEMGVEHALLPEKGIAVPGNLIIGADSHTCTYGALGAFASGVGSTDLAYAMATGKVWLKVPESIKFVLEGSMQEWVSGKDIILYIIGKIGVSGALYKAMEFTGPAVSSLSMDSRLSIANMAIEAGGKNGIFTPDEITEDYVKDRARFEYKNYKSDNDAEYCEDIKIDISGIAPQVSFPHLPENAKDVKDASSIVVDQVVIGSCTNGRIEDLEVAARILKGKKVNPNLRTIIIPATQAIYKEAMKRGYLEIFVDAGAAVSTPTCGPCLGGHMGILAKGEKAIATTNRNFVGRMGHPESEVYLSGPAVAAATAITGNISHPDEVMK